MAQFRDTENRTWTISVNITSVKRVKALLEVDLTKIHERPKPGQPDLMTQLATDPLVLANVLYVLLEPQLTKAGVSDEQFGEALAGDVIDHATTALLEALTDFFRGHQRRPMKRALEKLTVVQQKAEAQALRMLDSPDLMRQIDQILESPPPAKEMAASPPAGGT